MVCVSVIMSVYSEPVSWIKQAVDSILAQTFNEFEFVIVIDNPESKEQIALLEQYQQIDSRIRILYNSDNIGLAASLNKAIEASCGEYLARMDADDIAMPERFQIQLDYLNEHPDVEVCGTWAKSFGDLPLLAYRKYKMPVTSTQILLHSLFASPMIHPSVMIKASLLKRYRYDDKLRKAQDFDLWSRMLLQNVRFHNIPRFLMDYRITLKSKQIDSLSKQEEVAELVRGKMLRYVGVRFTRNDFDIHNKLCNCQSDNLKSSEDWLIRLRNQLIQNYPEEREFISRLVGERWALLAIQQGANITTYCKSKLYHGFSIVMMFRFIKRLL